MGNYDPASYEWMCNVLGGIIPRTGRAPIVRIMWQLGGIGKVIYRELEPSVRNPECVWDRVGGEKGRS